MAPESTIQEVCLPSSFIEPSTNNRPEIDALEPIAIVGFALKYPQDATTPEAFWKLLEQKKCAMTAWPKDRINLKAFYHDDDHVENNVGSA